MPRNSAARRTDPGPTVGAQRVVRATTTPLAYPNAPKRNRPTGRGSCLGVIELPSRPVNDYTIDRFLCALKGIEAGGTLRDAAVLTRAAMTESGFISGVLDTITGGTLGLPRNVIVEPGCERVKMDLEGRQGVGGDLDRIEPRAEAKQVMAWGITLGIGIGQLINPNRPPSCEPPAGTQPLPIGQPRSPFRKRKVCSLLAWSPEWLRYQWWDQRFFLTTSRGEIEIHPGDGEWVVFMPHGQTYPWRNAAWIYLVLNFILNRDAVFDRGRHMQMSPPVRVGTVPEGTTERQRRLFAKQIEDMQHFAWFVLPAGLKYDVVESSTSGQVDGIYAAGISNTERQIAIGLTGNEVMVEGNKGFATADVFERVTSTKRAFYAQAWQECEHEQILPWHIWETYGPDCEVPSVLRQTDPPEDQDKKIERLDKFGKALTSARSGLSDVGGELEWSTVQEIAQANGWDVRKKEETSAAPAGATIEVTPSAMEAAVMAGELRGQEGLPPFGDERDSQTIAELLGHVSEPITEAQDVPPA